MTIHAINGVFHRIEKNQNQQATLHLESLHPVNDDLKKFIQLVMGRFVLNSAYSCFDKENITSKSGTQQYFNNFIKLLEKTANKPDPDVFYEFSKNIANSLVIKLDQTPWTTGEHFSICHFKHSSDELMLITLVSLTDGDTIHNGKLQNVSYIESNKIKEAVVVDLSAYKQHCLDIENDDYPSDVDEYFSAYRYLRWLTFKGNRDVSDYIQEFMGAAQKINDSEATSDTRNIIRSYLKITDDNKNAYFNDDERSEAESLLIDFMHAKADSGEPVYAKDIITLIDGHFASNQKSCDTLENWLDNMKKSLPSGFVPSKKKTNAWLKVKLKTQSGMKVNAEKKHITSGEIEYNGRDVVTIHLKDKADQERFARHWNTIKNTD